MKETIRTMQESRECLEMPARTVKGTWKRRLDLDKKNLEPFTEIRFLSEFETRVANFVEGRVQIFWRSIGMRENI
jgi:hypothetical protein